MALAVAVGVYLTLALQLKSDDVGGYGPWGPSVPYVVIGALGVGLVAFVTGWNVLWLWPLATFTVAVSWEEALWDEPAMRYFTTEAFGAYPTVVMPFLVLFVPAAVVGVLVRQRADRAQRPGWFAPWDSGSHAATSTWVIVSLLQAGGFAWYFVARWFLAHTGDRVFADFVSGRCVAGSTGFAHVQGAIALAGLIALAVAIAARVSAPQPTTRVARVSLAIAGLAFAAWCVVVVGFQPRHDLGVYAGCGGA